ncbi:MAG: hypothetical protein PHC75_10555 [Burkholderiales bacterium]|nr:hypothetical protein [Burkholderiales bacterium]
MKLNNCKICNELKKIRAKGMCPECYRREYYKDNIEKIKKVNDKYHVKNKERIKEWNKEYYECNKNKILKKSSKYKLLRIKSDPNYRFMRLHSSRIRSLISKTNRYKYASSKDLLGAEVDVVIEHFKSQFTKGMTWEKFLNGEIHSDHIIPWEYVKNMDRKIQEKVFHYTNYQPLWAKDNLTSKRSLLPSGRSKNDKYINK